MAIKLDNLGFARVFRHPRTGELVVDTDTLRRGGNAGTSGRDAREDFGADDEEDFEGDDDDFEGEDGIEGEDEIEGDEDVDLGAAKRPRPRQTRRTTRRNTRQTRRQTRRTPPPAPAPAPRRQPPVGPVMDPHRERGDWGMTAVSGTDTLAAAGAASVKVRLQHDFRAQDVTFTGSASGAKVTSIFFGDRVVWSSSDGIDASVFGSTSLLRGLLRGQSLRAGLDITVNGSLTGAGDFAVTIIGEKPVNNQC